MRNITVVSTAASKKVTFQSNATTWGELKRASEMQNLLGSNMEGAVKETKVSLKSDDAILPDGDCTIFLVQSKTKAGVTREELQQIVEDKVDSLIEDMVEELCEVLGIEDNTEDLLDEAREFENL